MAVHRRIHRALLGLIVCVLVAGLAGAGVPAISAQGGAGAMPVDDKSADLPGDAPGPVGIGTMLEPPLGSKNAPAPDAAGLAGVGTAVAAEADSKNAGSGVFDEPQRDIQQDAGALALPPTLLTCGASGNLNWTTTSGTFQIVRQCTLTVPVGGQALIQADSSLAYQDGDYEALFEIDIDSTAGDGNVDRWVNVYADAGDGTDENMRLSVLRPVGAGQHTFYLLGRRAAGAGTVLAYDPTLSVIYVPGTGIDALTCGVYGNANWTTTSATPAVVRQCQITAPGPGWLYISGDGSLVPSGGEYEARFGFGIDTTTFDTITGRWVNVYTDATDGSDKSVALSVLRNVEAGAHTVYLLASRYGGAGTVTAYDPTLSVLFVPASSATAVSCGTAAHDLWQSTSSAFSAMRQCTLNVPATALAFVSADASMYGSLGASEGKFELGIDSMAGDQDVDRWVNVYPDTGDGTDKSMAISVVRPIAAGTHTFYLLGRRYSATGTATAIDPTLTVIVPRQIQKVYLPLVRR